MVVLFAVTKCIDVFFFFCWIVFAANQHIYSWSDHNSSTHKLICPFLKFYFMYTYCYFTPSCFCLRTHHLLLQMSFFFSVVEYCVIYNLTIILFPEYLLHHILIDCNSDSCWNLWPECDLWTTTKLVLWLTSSWYTIYRNQITVTSKLMILLWFISCQCWYKMSTWYLWIDVSLIRKMETRNSKLTSTHILDH